MAQYCAPDARICNHKTCKAQSTQLLIKNLQFGLDPARKTDMLPNAVVSPAATVARTPSASIMMQ